MIAFALVFGFVKPVVADSRYVGSESMVPTLKVGHGALQKDRVLVNKLAYDLGDPGAATPWRSGAARST